MNEKDASVNRDCIKIDEWEINGRKAEAYIVKDKLQIRVCGTIHNIELSSIQPKIKTGR